MKNKILNITNGDYFNEYFVSEFGGTAVPFRECMMDGDSVAEIFSDEFVAIRSQELNVGIEEYRKNMAVYDAVDKDRCDELQLWFGKDTFCQMNLLTLLAWLEQIKYCGRVSVNYIDDETFDIIESDINAELGIYGKMYEDILINKQRPDGTGVLVPRAIDLYFDYHSENGMLAKTVRDNSRKGHTELICLLLEISSEYGLSDIQAERLIEKYVIEG